MASIGDVVNLGFEKNGVNYVEDKLWSLFKLTDVGEISYYYGATFEGKRNVIGLRQSAYCRLVMERFGMDKKTSAESRRLIILPTCLKR